MALSLRMGLSDLYRLSTCCTSLCVSYTLCMICAGLRNKLSFIDILNAVSIPGSPNIFQQKILQSRSHSQKCGYLISTCVSEVDEVYFQQINQIYQLDIH